MSRGTQPCPLTRLPTEIIERTAFFLCTTHPIGPPTEIISLLCTSRALNDILALAHNPGLYASVFAAKFDVAAFTRRLAPWTPTASALRNELQARFMTLKRIRAAAARAKYPIDGHPSPHATTREEERDLWTVLLLLFEDDGLNILQVREYGCAHEWLKAYWLQSLRSAPYTAPTNMAEALGTYKSWAPDNSMNAIAMWCFWMTMLPDDHDWEMNLILRAFSLGAHKFSLSDPTWAKYSKPAPCPEPRFVLDGYLGHPKITLSATPLAAPALLSLHALENTPRTAGLSTMPMAHSGIPPPTLPLLNPSISRGSAEWDNEWDRFVRLGLFHSSSGRNKVEASSSGNGHTLRGTSFSGLRQGMGGFRPSSLHGIWEGSFMFTEFHAYAALLLGAPPSFLERPDVMQHQQSWRIREHHLLSPREPRALASGQHGTSVVSGPESETSSHTRSADSKADIGVDEPVNNDVPTYDATDASLLPTHRPHSTLGSDNLAPSPRFDFAPPSVGGFRCGVDPNSASRAYPSDARTTHVAVPDGDPLNAHMPRGAALSEVGGKLTVLHDGREYMYDSYTGIGSGYGSAYQDQSSLDQVELLQDEDPDMIVTDVIITGEGHSTWGPFSIIGRVRPLDGLITVIKRYMSDTDAGNGGGNRGSWLYRAYLVGDRHGNIAGRWRETVTPADQNGYEGCFVLTRRG